MPATAPLPRLLLLTRTPPGYAGVGGVFLQDLVRGYPEGRISCLTVGRSRRQLEAPALPGLPLAAAAATWSPALGRFARAGSAAGWVLGHWTRTVSAPALARRAAAFGRRQGVEKVWAVLNDPGVIHIAQDVARRLDVPLLTTVWDPPEAVAAKLGLDRSSRGALLATFADAVTCSEACGVASEAMAEEYSRRFGAPTVVLIHGVAPHLCRPPAEAPAEGSLTLGFAGSPYAEAEWQALLETLDGLGWRVEGRPVRLRTLGPRPPAGTVGREQVEHLGWQTLEETVRLLAETDLTYLPYWFDPAHRLSVRLCFPNKLTTYLAAGRPVLFHGPEDSSPVRFLRRYPAGALCHSLEPEDIAEALAALIRRPEAYRAATRAGQEALEAELGLDTFRRRFEELVGGGASRRDDD